LFLPQRTNTLPTELEESAIVTFGKVSSSETDGVEKEEWTFRFERQPDQLMVIPVSMGMAETDFKWHDKQRNDRGESLVNALEKFSLSLLLSLIGCVVEPEEKDYYHHFHCYSLNDVVVASWDGTEYKATRNNAHFTEAQLVLNDQKIVYESSEPLLDSLPEAAYDPIPVKRTLHLMNADGSGDEELLALQQLIYLSVSPDRAKLLWVEDFNFESRTIYVFDLNAKSKTKIASLSHLASSCFTGDSQRLVFVEDPYHPSTLISVNLSGGNKRVLLSSDSSAFTGVYTIPGSSTLLFQEHHVSVAQQVLQDNYELRTVNTDDGTVRTLVRSRNGRIFNIFCSPDGQLIGCNWPNPTGIVFTVLRADSTRLLELEGPILGVLFVDQGRVITSNIREGKKVLEIIDMESGAVDPLAPEIAALFSFRYSQSSQQFVGTTKADVHCIYHSH